MAISTLERLKAAKQKNAEGGGGEADKPLPKAYSLLEDASTPIKMLIYGFTGGGKTFFVVGLLLAGEKVFVLSTDFGANGLVTVKNELRRRGRLDLLSNLRVLDLGDYEHIIKFLEEPGVFVTDLNDYDPTVFVWEGFSSFNIDILDEYILTKAPGAEGAGELRHAGFTHTKQDWQGMKRGTGRAVRKFLNFSLPNGKPIHKIMTALESTPQNDAFTNKTARGALVHGSGRDLMGPGFDVIIEAFKAAPKGTEEEDKISFFYRCEGDSEKYQLKARGYDLKPIEPADPERIWKILRDQSAPKQI